MGIWISNVLGQPDTLCRCPLDAQVQHAMSLQACCSRTVDGTFCQAFDGTSAGIFNYHHLDSGSDMQTSEPLMAGLARSWA
jgi:hypothetical protein